MADITVVDIRKRMDTLALFGKIDALESELKNLYSIRESDGFWEDVEKSQRVNTEVAGKEKKRDTITKLFSLVDDLEVAIELESQEEVSALKSEIESILNEFEKEQYFSGKFDNKGVYMSIYSGAGGVDAEDFTAMLASMYQSLSKNESWNCQLINLSKGKEGGVKSITLQIDGEYVYGLLKEEIGVHRLIRISPFNSGNTRETSFAAVEVLPQGLGDFVDDIPMDDEDLKIDYFMASGKGGQSVNTTYSAVRITHISTGVSVSCQNERNQIQNKNQAMGILKNKLAVLELQKQKDFINDVKGVTKSIEWGSQIRSYTLHPYKLVKDHRSGFDNSNPEAFFNGVGIMDMIWSVKQNKG